MKTKTPFYIAAERFACETNNESVACLEIDHIVFNGMFKALWSDQSKYFQELFKPTEAERDEYISAYHNWLTSHDRTPEQNRQDRVIALLLADIIWKEENR